MAKRTLIPLLSLSLAACASPRERTATEAPPDCYACHGTQSNGNPAPPPLVSLPDMPPDAHQSHLQAASWHGPVPCDTCHPVPTQVNDPGHIDNAIQVTLRGEAAANGASPSFDPTTATCSGTYCHGATLTGGRLTNPDWFAVGSGQDQAACGSCHRVQWSPPLPGQVHPPRNDCASCHGTVVNSSLEFVNPALHVNGTIDVTNVTCNLCHGNRDGDPSVATSWAPPVDTQGRSDPTLMSVGAHQQHLAGSAIFRPVPCSACHVVPPTVTAPGHIDGQVTVFYGFPATANDAPTGFDATAGTCANWCHGSGFKTANDSSPVWNASAVLDCDTCHSSPPPPPHVQRGTCGDCHPTLSAATHVNGAVDFSVDLTCNLCHGNPDAANVDDPVAWAPPLDTEGRSDTTLPTVGAHQLHMAGGGWHRAVICSDCHTVPQTVTSPGHMDAQVELTWSDVASHDSTPAYDTGTATCSGVYCHGATMTNQTADDTPVWVSPFPAPTCGVECHGFPPASPHPALGAGGRCAGCHSDVGSGCVDEASCSDPANWVNPALHINGAVDY